MTFETFTIVYFSSGIASVALAYWYLRKQRTDLITLAGASVLTTCIFLAFYLEASEQIPDTFVEEHLLRAFTHLRKDLILSLSNAFMWCVVPFAIGLTVRKRLGEGFAWILFALLILSKPFFGDYFTYRSLSGEFHAFHRMGPCASWLVSCLLCPRFFRNQGK